MFQCAAARALALDRGAAFKLDVSAFQSYAQHQGFQLAQAFQGPFDIAAVSDLEDLLGWQRRPLAQRMLARASMASLRRKGLVVEPHFQHWAAIREAPAHCYLMGYWQSEKYFQGVAPTIRADFAFRSPLAGRNEALANDILGLNAVSLHVRRGDYVNDRTTAATHGVCSLDYYRKAIQYMEDRVDNPVVFVFSDDMPWVRQHLALPLPVRYVEHNERAYDDMHLMSLCKHHVIANSSFSWWGAWLNPAPRKIVVAPRQWFAVDRRTEDLLPASWVAL